MIGADSVNVTSPWHRRVSECFRLFQSCVSGGLLQYSVRMTVPAPERILVVDDDPALRELLGEYLSANGMVID